MKFKMSKSSLFAILLRSPWWISMLLVLVFVLAVRALLPPQYVAFGVIGSFPFLVIGVITAWRQWHAPSSVRLAAALAQAGAMSWRDFAAALETAFVAQGYAVTRLTGAAADLQLVKAGRKTLVSCKRWKAANHGVEALRDLAAAKDALEAQACIYISLGAVTQNARVFAQTQGIQLMSEDDLAALLAG